MHGAQIDNLEMFEHSYYGHFDDELVPRVPTDHRKGVYHELFDFVGWRYENAVQERILEAKCHHCLEEDLGALGISPLWSGFLFQWHRPKEKYSEFVQHSKEMNEHIAVQAAVEVVAGIKAAAATMKEQGMKTEGTPTVYNKDTPFGFDSHNVDVFVQTLKEGVKDLGIKVMDMDEFLVYQMNLGPRH